MGLRSDWRGKMTRWAYRRAGDDTLPRVLHARRIYILPTATGLFFALVVTVMLIAGLNYNNSLGLLLAFLSGAFMLVGMLDCQRNLKGLAILKAEAMDCFAGEAAQLHIEFENAARSARHALRLRHESGSAREFELEAGGLGSAILPFPTTRRGRQAPGPITLSTTAPLGLFRAWTWLHLPVSAVVYPRPIGRAALPASADLRQPGQHLDRAGAEQEWAALRPFQPGDSPRSVAWKHYARGAPLLVSQYQGLSGVNRILDLAAAPGADLEARLSQLCAWLLECEQRRENYAVRLAGKAATLGLGAEHRRESLRALALHAAPPA